MSCSQSTLSSEPCHTIIAVCTLAFQATTASAPLGSLSRAVGRPCGGGVGWAGGQPSRHFVSYWQVTQPPACASPGLLCGALPPRHQAGPRTPHSRRSAPRGLSGCSRCRARSPSRRRSYSLGSCTGWWGSRWAGSRTRLPEEPGCPAHLQVQGFAELKLVSGRGKRTLLGTEMAGAYLTASLSACTGWRYHSSMQMSHRLCSTHTMARHPQAVGRRGSGPAAAAAGALVRGV